MGDHPAAFDTDSYRAWPGRTGPNRTGPDRTGNHAERPINRPKQAGANGSITIDNASALRRRIVCGNPENRKALVLMGTSSTRHHSRVNDQTGTGNNTPSTPHGEYPVGNAAADDTAALDEPVGFSIDRGFRVWRQSVSHRMLLLRSHVPDGHTETVDVWFNGVVATKLHAHIPSLTIRAADPDERAEILDWAADDIYDVIHRPPLFLILESAKPAGFVVCAQARIGSTRDEPSARFSIFDNPNPDATRLLWSAGMTGDGRCGYTLHEPS
ncbi:hypothetical protein OG948_02960 [Embleya sp. NBC_00888]|uniref:hypothetical protein n=1 Tax=Embleya sp. NBC_00888 TaxID=2975960 RepID=UPI00386E7DFD|nr:hypothetical protein OG948_02960 [Embleya sp. NBC_00888]